MIFKRLNEIEDRLSNLEELYDKGSFEQKPEIISNRLAWVDIRIRDKDYPRTIYPYCKVQGGFTNTQAIADFIEHSLEDMKYLLSIVKKLETSINNSKSTGHYIGDVLENHFNEFCCEDLGSACCQVFYNE